MQKILAPREVITVDAACIVAMTTTINFQLKNPNQLRRAVFGVSIIPSCFLVICSCSQSLRNILMQGDNQLTASLTGPGVVFIQSLPFHRLSQRIARYDKAMYLLHCSYLPLSVHDRKFILVLSSSRSVAGPSLRDNPKFFIQIVMFFFLAYVMIVSSIILTDV